MQKKYKKKQMQKKYNNSKVRAIQNTKTAKCFIRILSEIRKPESQKIQK